MLNLPAYLARIAYSGSTDPSPKTLRALHRAHMFAVPFDEIASITERSPASI